MIPKEKAKELVDRFYEIQLKSKGYASVVLAKQCALICVDEIIEDATHDPFNAKTRIEYWQEVKQEIEKL